MLISVHVSVVSASLALPSPLLDPHFRFMMSRDFAPYEKILRLAGHLRCRRCQSC